MPRRFSPFALALLYLMVCPVGAGLMAGENPPIADARAWLRINDGRWLDQLVTRFSAAAGSDTKPLQAALARQLFLCRSLDGIDLTRPAWLAWRGGNAPLVAVIPVTNRSEFVASFGVAPDGDPPLVRVSDRDGTAVFTQSRASGMWEYRLLISNGVAYLARSVDECRRLAAIPIPFPPSGAPPVAFTASGEFLASQGLPVGIPFAPPGSGAALFGGLLPDFSSPYALVMAQVDTVTWGLQAAGSDGLRLTASATAKPGSALLDWLALQRNQPNRLSPALRGPDTALTFFLQASWQGVMEAYMRSRLPEQKLHAGKRWSEAAAESWNTLAALSDRTTGEAFAWSLWPEAKGPSIEIVNVHENARASEVVTELERQAAVVSIGETTVETSETLKVSHRKGHLDVERPRSGRMQIPFESRIFTCDRFAVLVQGINVEAAKLEKPDELAKRLLAISPPEDEPCLAAAWLDLSRFVRAFIPPQGEIESLTPVEIKARITVLNGGLALDCSMPVIALGQLFGQISRIDSSRPVPRRR